MDRLKHILAQRLDAAQRVLPEHLSPDALSALLEQRLRASERERALHHLAACRMCRDAVTLAAAEVVDAAEVSMAKARARFASWGTFRWASAAAALAVAIGAGVLIHERQPPISHPQIRAAEVVAPPASAPSNQVAEKQEPAPSISIDEASRNEKSRAKLAQDRFGKSRSVLEAKSQRPAGAKLSRRRSQSPLEMASAAPISSASANAVTPQPIIDAAQGSVAPAAPAALSPAAASSDLTLTAQEGAKEQEAVARKAMRATAIAGPVRARAVNGELVSWRVSSGRLERRSQDGGLTLIEPAPGFSVRTIAANGIEVWAAGPNSNLRLTGSESIGDSLYHSSDAGQSWTRVSGPWHEPIAHVSMLPQAAVRVATQSRSWITHDGGQSWTETVQQ